MSEIKRLRSRLDKSLVRFVILKKQVRQEQETLRSEYAKLEAAEQALEIVQHVAQTVQQQAHKRISSVVSRCLEVVFEEEAYEFVLDFVRKRSKTEARLRFVRDKVNVTPKTSSSGGQIDVAAFALRLACVLLSRPRRRRLIVLDEPFRFLDEDAEPKIPTLLLTLAKEFSIQIILVTHSNAFATAETKVIKL